MKNTWFSFVLEEHLLQREVGGAEAMREQIDHLLALTALRNVEIQIMPGWQAHAGSDGPLQLLETPDNQRFAYCEGQESGQFVSDPNVVGTLNLRYARMRSQALTIGDSTALWERRRGTL